MAWNAEPAYHAPVPRDTPQLLAGGHMNQALQRTRPSKQGRAGELGRL